MAVRIAIAGAAGRMGQRLVALAREDPGLALAAALERPGHPWLGKDIGTLTGQEELRVRVGETLEAGADVLLDFTAPEAAVEHAERGAALGMALVIGTTGLTEAQRERLSACARKVPLIHAPNFSVGVNVLLRAAALVARTLGPEYEVEIVEAHHDLKADAPSGTALALAAQIAQALGRDLKKDAVYGRHGQAGKRPKGEIGIHAVRMGDVVGEHTAYFAIGGERLELTHRASSRDTFVRGALRAAKWLAQPRKSPGTYTMAQVLGLE